MSDMSDLTVAAPDPEGVRESKRGRVAALLSDSKRRARVLRRRSLSDRVSRAVIGVGGVSVIMALGLIFLYLFSEVLPMLLPASVHPVQIYAAPGGNPAPTVHLAMDRHREVGVRFDGAGAVTFFRPQDGVVIQQERLPVPEGVTITSVGPAESRTRLLAFGLSDGTAILVKHAYRETYPDDRRVVHPELSYPFGDEPLPVDEQGRALRVLAVQEGPTGTLVAGVTEEGITLVSFEARTSFMTGEVTVTRSAYRVDVTLPGLTHLLIGMDLRTVLAADASGHLHLLEASAGGQVVPEHSVRVVPEGVRVSAIEFLLGTVSVIVGGSDGSVVQWMPVRQEDNSRQLARVRAFESHPAEVTVIRPAYSRKGFATGDSAGTVRIHFSTSHRTLASVTPVNGPVRMLAKAPRGDGLLVASAAEQVAFLDVENEYPQASFTALWDMVWYEGYADPDYIWQSTSATDEFEGKFSLVPLTIGTLKGAFYAMLFAIPLAIMGAFYTGYFMTPRMRGMVKPTIEIMEALPTVILGFLAGLWFAPFVERHLPAVFAVLLLMPLAMVFAAYAWSHVPRWLHTRVPDGWEAALLVPVVLAVGWFCVAMSPIVELAFFGGDMRQWLTDQGITYDQRNALVVGVAMGFAVIPTIFSIAEDAVFTVPKHLTYGSLALGATPWQTMVRVVALTASPGIFSAVMIGLGRAVGETMIVLMATGNSPVVNFNIFEGMRTLSANIAVEMPEAEAGGTHYRILFLAALVLFGLTFVFNTAAEIVRQRLRRKYAAL
jgi:phosphate transport system permease protein